jgi:uncharacterized metal-binding protein YceD (DUF177 family)
MGNPLRDSRTAAELASVGQLIEFTDNISSFDGLSGVIEADLAALEAEKIPSGWRDNVVAGELQFGFADAAKRVPMVKGIASTSVDAVCQRCLEPFKLQLRVEPKLLLLSSQQADDGFEGFEVWELEKQTMRPSDVIDELLIMAMPLSAMHDTMAECKAFSSAEQPERSAADELVKPFAALRSQMTRNEDDPAE